MTNSTTSPDEGHYEPTTADEIYQAAVELERCNHEAADALRRALAYIWKPNPDLHPVAERAREPISNIIGEGIEALHQQGATIGNRASVGAGRRAQPGR